MAGEQGLFEICLRNQGRGAPTSAANRSAEWVVLGFRASLSTIHFGPDLLPALTLLRRIGVGAGEHEPRPRQVFSSSPGITCVWTQLLCGLFCLRTGQGTPPNIKEDKHQVSVFPALSRLETGEVLSPGAILCHAL